MDAELEACLKDARTPKERQSLLDHATTQGECDAEYCPWAYFKESLCTRKQTHSFSCRCPDCCEDYDD